ncbi:release factor [Trametes sanguinea]|nr:release factor [Trametes sanguinea]
MLHNIVRQSSRTVCHRRFLPVLVTGLPTSVARSSDTSTGQIIRVHSPQRRHKHTGPGQNSLTAKDVAADLREAVVRAEARLDSVQHYLQSDLVLREVQEKQAMLEDPYLWISKPGIASEVQARLLELQRQLSTRDALRKSLEKLKERAAAAQVVGDPDIQRAVLLEVKGLQHSTAEYLRSLWLSDPLEQGSAFVEIRAASSDQEACEWAATLARMYAKWADSKNYAVQIVNETPGDTAGVKSTTLVIEGPYAFGLAQYESGVHRLERASPSDEAGAETTSAASVRVLPYIEEDGSNTGVEVNATDLEVVVAHGQRTGDSHIDETRDAVHVLHVPTGIEVTCQQQCGEYQNRALALSLLRAKLYAMESRKKAQSAADAQEVLPAHPWDSEIRSYVLQPHPLVKDLRTEFVARSNAAQQVLDGDLQELMEASLRKFKKKV